MNHTKMLITYVKTQEKLQWTTLRCWWPKIRLPKPSATNPHNPNRKQSAKLEENHIEKHLPRPNKMPSQPLIRSSTQYIGAKMERIKETMQGKPICYDPVLPPFYFFFHLTFSVTWLLVTWSITWPVTWLSSHDHFIVLTGLIVHSHCPPC